MLKIATEPEKALGEINRVLGQDRLLLAPNFVSHKSGLMSRLWSGILKLVGIKFEHQWSGEEYLGWLEENGWKMQYAKNFPTRIALMYAECIRKSE